MNSVFEDLIASRMYPLNKSKSKFGVVGLTKQSDKIWTPCVRIVGQFWKGVSLTSEEWTNLVQNKDRLLKYYDGENVGDEISLSPFTSVETREAFGSRTVVFKSSKSKLF